MAALGIMMGGSMMGGSMMGGSMMGDSMSIQFLSSIRPPDLCCPGLADEERKW